MADTKKTRRAPLREACIASLEQRGPMSISDIALTLNLPIEAVRHAIHSTRYTHPGQHFRIVNYRWQESGSGREIPIYAAQGGEDKPRPQATKERHNAQKRAHYQRHKARINAKAAAKRAAASKVVNPWLQLAPKSIRPVMSRIAHMDQQERRNLEPLAGGAP